MPDIHKNEEEQNAPSNLTALLTLMAIYVCGGLSHVLQISFTLLLERDWMVSILGYDSSGRWLMVTNVILKQIHLVCIILDHPLL